MKNKPYFIGDACLCWSFGDHISREISAKVLDVFRILAEKQTKIRLGIRDLVPSYKALAIHFDPSVMSAQKLEQTVGELIVSMYEFSGNTSKSSVKSVEHQIPVIYSGEDLGRVAEINKLDISDVVRIHQKPTYTVAMIGFQPYFPYLIGLDSRLTTPRLDSPRTKVPSGTVAIGGEQTGIYPQESPGGWNIIGLTRPELLKSIEPGDNIIFNEVEKL